MGSGQWADKNIFHISFFILDCEATLNPKRISKAFLCTSVSWHLGGKSFALAVMNSHLSNEKCDMEKSFVRSLPTAHCPPPIAPLLLFDMYAAMHCDASHFHDNVVIDKFMAGVPPGYLFNRTSQRECEFLVASLECAVP